MKLSNKILFLFTLMVAATSLSASQNQTEWYSATGSPAVRVFVKGAYVYAQLDQGGLNDSAIKLKHVNGDLLHEYGADYIRIRDFNADGSFDIGVLTGAGYGGSDMCYAVFEYLPDFYAYKTRSSKTVCFN